jgi:hypothetical protein
MPSRSTVDGFPGRVATVRGPTDRPIGEGPAGEDVVVEVERPPLRLRCAAGALLRCMAVTARLSGQRRVRQPTANIGRVLRFADGTGAPVYRETVLRRAAPADPAVLVVEFRLRWVRGRGHALFRAESVLNTPLFVGFPGFVSKLWLAHDQHDAYRGVYQWDGSERAHAYARALWWALALVSVPWSIHYVVLPGLRRDDVVAGRGAPAVARDAGDWWRPVGDDVVAT